MGVAPLYPKPIPASTVTSLRFDLTQVAALWSVFLSLDYAPQVGRHWMDVRLRVIDGPFSITRLSGKTRSNVFTLQSKGT
jgi:hypothetical protein